MNQDAESRRMSRVLDAVAEVTHGLGLVSAESIRERVRAMLALPNEPPTVGAPLTGTEIAMRQRLLEWQARLAVTMRAAYGAAPTPPERPLMLLSRRLVAWLLARTCDQFVKVVGPDPGNLAEPLPPLFRAGPTFMPRLLDEHDRAFSVRFLRVADADFGHWSLVAPLAWWNAPTLALLWALYGLERAEAWLLPWLWRWGLLCEVAISPSMLMTRIRRAPSLVSDQPLESVGRSRANALTAAAHRLLGEAWPGPSTESIRVLPLTTSAAICEALDHLGDGNPDSPPSGVREVVVELMRDLVLRPTSPDLEAIQHPSDAFWRTRVRLRPDAPDAALTVLIERLDAFRDDGVVLNDAGRIVLSAGWASVMEHLRAPGCPAWSPHILRNTAARLDALGLLDPAARTFEVLDEFAPDQEAALFRYGYSNRVAPIVLALVRHDERAAFEAYLLQIGGPVGMTMDEAWEGTRRRLAKACA